VDVYTSSQLSRIIPFKFARLKISYSAWLLLACVASVSTGLSSGLKHSSLFERAKIGASAKKCEKGKGKGEKETLARKPHDFEKPVRPRTEFPDWRGMEVLIAK